MINRIFILLIPLLSLLSKGICVREFQTYLLGLIQESRYFSALGFSRKTSRMLPSLYNILQKRLPWEKILYTLAKSLLNSGDWFLIVDATPLKQEHARYRIAKHGFVLLEGMKNVPHDQMISLILTNGQVQLVLDYRIWVSPKVAKARDYRPQTDLALDLIKRAQFMQLPVKKIVFDSFFASKAILTWLNGNGFEWTTRLKGNRIVFQDGKASRVGDILKEEHETTLAELKGIPGTVKITRIHYQDEVVYAVTNNASLPQRQLVRVYRLRWKIEEFHRDAKQNLGLEYLRMRNYRALKKSRGLCLPGIQHPVCTTGK